MGVIVDREHFDSRLIVYPKPFEPRGESAVSDQLALAMIPREAILALKAPRPRIPSQDQPHEPELTVEQATGAPPSRSWFAIGMRGQGDTPRPNAADSGLSGSARNVMGSVGPYG